MSEQFGGTEIQAMREKLMRLMGNEVASYPHNIEKDYPRILKKLIEVWGTPELPKYLDELTFSTRAGRAGFPSGVAMDLFNLGNLHAVQEQVPDAGPGGWSGGATI